MLSKKKKKSPSDTFNLIFETSISMFFKELSHFQWMYLMQVWWTVLSAQQRSPEELVQPRTLYRAGTFSKAQAGASACFARSMCLQQYWNEKLRKKLLQTYLPSLPFIPVIAPLVEWVAGLCSLWQYWSPGHLFNAVFGFFLFTLCAELQLTAPGCSNCMLHLYALFIGGGRRKGSVWGAFS